MTRVDLHLHSCYSRHPAEWFLKRLGTQESYTEIDVIYQSVKERGMSFVTLTDHNTIDGALELNRRYPEDTFISVETTTYFPENGCKIHLLIYDINPEQFADIDRLRSNIYHLRAFLVHQGIVHSVAHATYSINNRLEPDLVEKLILLFNTFEGINGARSPYYAKQWMGILKEMTPMDIIALEKKHGIKPHGKQPWIKGFTAGSDDHAGLFQGLTYTSAPACPDPKTFLNAVRDKKTKTEGRSNDFKTFAFSIYKIAYDFSKHKAGGDPNDLFSLLSQMLFEQNGPLLAQALFPNKPGAASAGSDPSGKGDDALILEFFSCLAKDLKDTREGDMDEKFNRIYMSIAALIDNYFIMVMESVAVSLKNISVSSLIKNLLSSFPFFFLSTPFVTSLRHLSRDRVILARLREQLGKTEAPSDKKVLWFTDTIYDLNGVAVTLNQVAWHAFRTNRNLTVVACHGDGDSIQGLPPNVMNLTSVYAYTSALYSSYTMHFPSLLKAIDRISAANPDRIIISTPGPVGMVGLLAARMLGIPCTGVYHTDFKTQMDLTIKDPTLSALALQYERLFYSTMDEIRVPSATYIQILKERHYPENKLKVFERGINAARFNHNDRSAYGFTLVWAGRVSHDKNISFLLDLFETVQQEEPDVKLLMAGNGPDFNHFKDRTQAMDGVTMTGNIDHEKLADFYNQGDLFVFPSTMDTFGMVVLEAQACGIPALVTDIGGPREIVKDGVTGKVLSLKDKNEWVAIIRSYIKCKALDPKAYSDHKAGISRRILSRYSWERALADMIDLPNGSISDIKQKKSYAKSA